MIFFVNFYIDLHFDVHLLQELDARPQCDHFGENDENQLNVVGDIEICIFFSVTYFTWKMDNKIRDNLHSCGILSNRPENLDGNSFTNLEIV